MVTSSRVVLDHLHTILARRSGAEGDDGQLLRQFAQTGDGEAFAALVRRHGSMVLGLARRVVGDWQTAEDLFQATFLMLAQKAHTIRRPEALSCWLHGVAYRFALRTRQRQSRRKEREAHVRPVAAPSLLDELTARELLSVLDEEVQALPEKERAAVLLCCLEGLSQEETAKRLRCSAGAVKGRLERGRNQLRRRLERRGLMLPAVLGGTLLLAETASAIPPALLQSTLQAVTQSANATPAAAALVHEAMQTMGVNRMRVLGAILMLLTVTGGGLALLGSGQPVTPEEPAVRVVADKKDAEPATTPQKGKDLHGDPLPPGAVLRLGTLRQRAVGAKLAASADGKTIISVRGGKSIRFWDAASGELRRQLELQGDEWGPVELSRDGRMMARVVLAPDYRLEIWDVPKGEKIRDLIINGKGSIMPVAFSADGKRVAAVGHRREGGTPDGREPGKLFHLVRAWDVAGGKEIFAADVQNSCASIHVYFTPDGKRLLASFGSVEEGTHCWDIATGKQIWQNKTFGFLPSAFTPDGKILALGNRAPLAVDRETGRDVPVANLPPLKWDTQLTLLPNGQTFLVTNEQGITVWDLKHGKELRSLKGASGEILVLPDGKNIVTNNGALQRWDLETGKALWPSSAELGHVGEVEVVAFSADGKRLISASTDGTVRLWDAVTGRPLRIWRGHEGKRPGGGPRFFEAGVKTLDLSADGRRVVSAGTDECIKVWDIEAAEAVRSIPLPPAERGEANRHFYHVRISPDGRRIVGFYGPRGGFHQACQPAPKLTDKLAVWDADTGNLLEIHPFEMGHVSGLLSPDAATLLAKNALIDVLSARKIAELPDMSNFFPTGTFSPDGALLVGQAQKTTRKNGMDYANADGLAVWEVATGKIVARLKTKSWVAQTIFYPGNHFLAVNQVEGVLLRDVRSGEELQRVKMPTAIPSEHTRRASRASCLALSLNGRRLATGMPDSTILIWDVRVPKVSVVPLRAGELETLWNDLADADAAKAWQAVWRLSETPNDIVPFLSRHLRPYPTASADQTRELLADLDSDSFARREAALKRLKELGLQAEPALRAALEAKPSLEQKRRIEGILADLMTTPQPLTVNSLRQLRALIVLERIGSRDARRLLEEVAKGPPSASVTRQARAALACLP